MLNFKLCALVIGLMLSTTLLTAQTLPYLKTENGRTQLIVDGKPFLMLAGELSNSASGSIEDMNPSGTPLPRKVYKPAKGTLGNYSSQNMAYTGSVWDQMEDLNVNTVLAVVSWEMIEPEEGKYDFSVVDAMLEGARKKDIKLIPLWFGTWKNGMSSYVPLWVKQDYKRFPRTKIKKEGSIEVVSTFSKEALEADAKAFTAFMRHIKKVDSKEQTVIMVQVENEVGILGDSRDRSLTAEEAFNGSVPKQLVDYLKSNKESLIPELAEIWAATGYKESGTWPEVFGSSSWTDLIFMAWNYSVYMNEVTKRGKEVYNLPMFVNAWLEYPSEPYPGGFPSGGPVPRVMDIWKAGAPDVDFMAPDIYGTNFIEWCDKYTSQGDPLFIPETWWNKPKYVQFMFYALGHYNTLGVAPFGVDRIDPLENPPLKEMFSVAEYLAPEILKYQGDRSKMVGFMLDLDNPSQEFEMENYYVKAELYSRRGKIMVDDAFGMIIKTGENEFTISGTRATISFRPKEGEETKAGIGPVDEYEYHNGRWINRRRLGGDETNRGRAVYMLMDGIGIQKAIVYKYN
ncbi:MAG: DUF5597 domain-containing protein [Cyclobacteriaceae bacterium]